MELELRQRITAFIVTLIFMVPNFHYLINLPDIVEWLGSNEILNSVGFTVLLFVFCFGLLEFLEWRDRRSPETEPIQISLNGFPGYLSLIFRWIGNLLLGILAACIILGFCAVIISTFVVNPPYKFWVWGLMVVGSVIFPWGQALSSVKNGLDFIKSRLKEPSKIGE